MIEFENQAQKGGNLQVITGNEQALVADAGASDRSPEQSMRDTQQSFTSLHQSVTGGYDQMSGVSPTPGGRRFTYGAGNSTHTGWNERQNSEIRISRKASELGTLEPKSSRNQGGRMDSMRLTTNQSWAAKGDVGQRSDAFLPEINDGPLGSARRRAPLPDTMSGVGSNRAAGFKRDAPAMQSGYNHSPKKSERQSRLFGGVSDSPRYAG